MSNDQYQPNSVDAVLSRIETTQRDTLNAVNAIRETQAKDSGRIGALENWRFWVLGAAAGVGAAGSLLANKLFPHIKP